MTIIQNLELLQAYLEDIDCTTVPAHNGIEALEIIASTPAGPGSARYHDAENERLRSLQKN